MVQCEGGAKSGQSIRRRPGKRTVAHEVRRGATAAVPAKVRQVAWITVQVWDISDNLSNSINAVFHIRKRVHKE
jgi:hypothetical protein